jgi:DNA-binding FadR family transcriptional regulator
MEAARGALLPVEAMAAPDSSGSRLLYRTVQDQIKRYIVEHDLHAGDALPPETHLVRDLGVSRPSVREAVKALESLGILETRPGKGLFVRPFSLDPILDNLAYSLLFDHSSIAELLEVREQLEVGLLPRAIAAMTADRMSALRGIVQRMQARAERGEPFPGEDRAFHRTLAEAAGNRLQLRLLDVFWVVFQRLRDRALQLDAAPPRTWRNHQRILDHVEAMDAPAAQRAMADHFDDLKLRLRAAEQRRQVPAREPAGPSTDGAG